MYSNKNLALALAFIATSGCYGVSGGEEQLSEKFSGIDSVEVISPTTALVRWSQTNSYVNYNVFISAQNAPVNSSVFTSALVTNLEPGQNYFFSVAGIKESGAQDGLTKQLPAQMWTHFPGPTGVTALSSNAVRLNWEYRDGPTFQVFMNEGAPPLESQIRGTPLQSTTSTSGTVIMGLKPNTSYYFSVVARYGDESSSLDNYTLKASSVNVQFTSSDLPANIIDLIRFPKITSAANVLSTAYPVFTVTDAAETFVIEIYDGAIAPANLIGSRSGSGTITSNKKFPVGTYNLNIRVRDLTEPSTPHSMIGVLSDITSTLNPISALPSVSVTTPTTISPLPIVTGPGIQLGQFPTFVITNSSDLLRTELWAGTTMIGSTIGEGTITTLTTTPLPRGTNTIQPKAVVISTGEWTYLPTLNVTIKYPEPAPITGPATVNGGGAGAGVGTSMTTGDFNCDGYPDLAMGAPNGPYTKPANYNNDQRTGWSTESAGGVVVYYGSATGLIGLGSDTQTAIIPSVTPSVLKNPLLIPAPNTANNTSTNSLRFGFALAAGNINNTSVGANGCDALIVGAPGDKSDNWLQDVGAFYVYYGSPNGLQVSANYTYNTITCVSAGSYTCMTGKYGVEGESNELYTRNAYWGGLGSSVAVGDFNGDGFADVAAGFPNRSLDCPAGVPTPVSRCGDGAVYLYLGSANGLVPTPVRFYLNQTTDDLTHNYTRFGISVAFGKVTDNPANANRATDLIVSAPGYQEGNGSGVFVIRGPYMPGVEDIDTIRTLYNDAVTTRLILPPTAGSMVIPIQPGGIQNGYRVATIDLNKDDYDDIVFSSPWETTNGYGSNGAIYAYYGQLNTIWNKDLAPVENTSNCTVIPGPETTLCNPQRIYRTDSRAYWYFGTSLANLGDIDGDGYSDLGVGAQGANPARTGTTKFNGMAYIYYTGQHGLRNSPSTEINLTSPKYSHFGASIAGADFNQTNGNDVIVGAAGEVTQPGTAGHGIAHLFQNEGSGFPTRVNIDNARTPVTPAFLSIQNFNSAKIVGDLNGDGYADIAAAIRIPGPSFDPTYADPTSAELRSAMVVYYGSANGLITTPAPQITPVNPTDPLLVADSLYLSPYQYTNKKLATFVLPGGDINGDGFKDVITASTTHIYAFYGSSGGLIASVFPKKTPARPTDAKIVSDGTGAQMTPQNENALTTGDFNYDGCSDIAVTYTNTGFGTPPVFIIYGHPNGIYSGGNILSPTDTNFTGQYNAETDVRNKAVQTPTCTIGVDGMECRPLQICPATGSTKECTALSVNLGMTGSGLYFTRAKNVGDVSGDGTDDLILTHINDSSDYNGTTYNNAGALYLFYGNSVDGINPTRRVLIRVQPQYVPKGVGTDRAIGAAGITPAGDINGDNLNDFIVTAPNETTGAGGVKRVEFGAAYVFYGISNGYASVPGACPGGMPCTINISPINLTPALNTTPDYIPTHIVDSSSNSCHGTTKQCNVLRFFPTWTTAANFRFGSGAIGLGDITGDSYADVAIAANGVTPSKIYVFSGGKTGLQINGQPSSLPTCSDGSCPPLAITPITTNTSLSYNISDLAGAGDIDKDGRNDFFFSSPYLDDANGNGFWLGGFFLFR